MQLCQAGRPSSLRQMPIYSMATPLPALLLIYLLEARLAGEVAQTQTRYDGRPAEHGQMRLASTDHRLKHAASHINSVAKYAKLGTSQ